MKIQSISSDKIKEDKDSIIIIITFLNKEISTGNKNLDIKIKKLLNRFSLDEGEMRLFYDQENSLLIFNAGNKKDWNLKKFCLSIRTSLREVKNKKFSNIIFHLNNMFIPNLEINYLIEKATENVILAEYDFNKYKLSNNNLSKIKEVSFLINGKNFNKSIQKGIIIGKAVNFARDLSNTPGGEMTPKLLSLATIKEFEKIKNIKIEIFNKKKLKELKMGGLLGVSQGSAEEPQMIIIYYLGNKNKKEIDLAFVGKGLTFDSGGLNLKTGDSMLDMHMDMSGGSAVLGSIKAISALKIPLNIVCVIPAAENMPSQQAFRPGDLLKVYNGKTIEVANTDAEGRIILADALSFVSLKIKPKMIIDVATLTGAAVVALGYRAIALFTNRDHLENDLKNIGYYSGDYVWPLPLWDDYQEEIKGTFGDISNMGNKKGAGGSIIGAIFLKNFINNCPWIHLDIAPTMTSIEGQGIAKGATGTGVRFLIELAKNFKDLSKKI